MRKLEINLTNCYGIGSLNQNIEYKNDNDTTIIYAPNGTMKTSLTRTIRDLIAGKVPKDLFYPDRDSNAGIKIDDIPISSDNVYIFDSEGSDCTEYISSFLANKHLKEEYDAIYLELENEKRNLKRAIKSKAHSTDCEDEILSTFRQNENDNFFDCLLYINERLNSQNNYRLYDFRYNDVFDKAGAVEKFLNDNKDKFYSFFIKYKQLIDNSSFFKGGDEAFGTSQAAVLLKSVADGRYFKADHKLVLKDGKEITSDEELEKLINDEINKILQDENLKEAFDKIDKELQKNKALQAFKETIQADKSLIAELNDYKDFNQRVILGYIAASKDDFDRLLELFNSKKGELQRIIEEANAESERWKSIIEQYNKRFFVPFKVSIENKADVLLKKGTASLCFTYQDGEDSPQQEEKASLLNGLSRGERKAFYILQNLFAIEAKIVEEKPTLLIFDDVADSFDYKNKYAIIEYLADLKDNPLFSLFILTHNFDFYRTVVSRVSCAKLFFTEKSKDRKVELKQGIYRDDLIKNILIDNVNNKSAFIGLIPFARNIIEYTDGDNDNYKLLTSCLHMKDKTKDIKINEISETFKILKNYNPDAVLFKDSNYIEVLMNEAEQIYSNLNEISLTDKMVLSIAIRLKAEIYMKSILNEHLTEMEQNKDQTGKLVKLFKKYHNDDKRDECMILNKVLMMTSENIHFNNFMFEPLVDLSPLYLKELYEEVKDLSVE